MDVISERTYPTPMVNSTLLPMFLLSLATQKHSPRIADEIDTEYDYIVVGAGSAGSVIASRLSEMPCLKVLLLEAGGPPPLLTEVPAFSEYFQGTELDWNFKTIPQKYVGDGLINRQLPYHSGKGLGGSSILNNMLYVRGNKKDFDQWAAEGAKGWSYKDVLPYFKKMEDNRDKNYVLNGFHGEQGPITVHQPRYRSEWEEPFFKTIKSMGYKVIDPNGSKQTGFYDIQNTLKSGQRCSTAKAYLVPAENRTNLDILPYAMVRKILIKEKQAVGVQFDYENYTYEVKARREVILSAGAIKTAQLLKLSGIGPRKELESFNIPVIADLPVGFNLQDHPVAFTNFLLKRNIPNMAKKFHDPQNVQQYIQNRTGPLASPGITAVAFLKNKDDVSEKHFPDYQLTFSESQIGYPVNLGLTRKFLTQVYKPYKGRSFYTCFCSLLHPKSRGTVTLQSTDPYDSPVIDPNYFDDPKDIQKLVEGLKTCLRIGNHPLMRSVGSIPFQTLVPGCEKYAENENSYLECAVQSAIVTFGHGVGTARMGDPKDSRTVVDPYLRVLHIKGLRVVDASVMTNIPSGDPYIPSIMIAEKASDIIKSSMECIEDHEQQPEGTNNPRRFGEIVGSSVQPYSRQKNINKKSRRKPSSVQPSESYSNLAFSESKRKKTGSARPADDYPNPTPSHIDLDEGHWESNRGVSNKLHNHEFIKVTPWNKEIPNVTPWNDEIMKSNALNAIAAQTPSNNPNSLISNNQQITLAGTNFLISQLINLFNNQQQQGQGPSSLPQVQGMTNPFQPQTGGLTSLLPPQITGADNIFQPAAQMATNLPQSQTGTNTASSQSSGNSSPLQLPNTIPQQQMLMNIPQTQTATNSALSQSSEMTSALQTSNITPQTQMAMNVSQQLLSLQQLQRFVNNPQMQAFLNNPQLQSLFNNSQLQSPSNNSQLQSPSNNPQLQSLFNNPQLQSLFNNSQLQSPSNNPQFQSLFNNPQLQSLFNNPQLQSLFNNPQLQSFFNNPQLQSLFNNPQKQSTGNALQTQTPSNLIQNNNPMEGRIPKNVASQTASNQPISLYNTFNKGNASPWQSVWRETPTHVVPWNKENPNVTPWNQELIASTQLQTPISNQQMVQTTRPNNSNQITSGIQNPGQQMSTAQNAASPQQQQTVPNSNQMEAVQTPPTQTQSNMLSQIVNGQLTSVNLIENLRQLQQNLQTQIPLLAERQQFMQNLLEIVQEMLSLLSPNLTMGSVRRSDIQFQLTRNRQSTCSFLLKNMQCKDISCQNRKSISTYMHSQICK